MTKEIRTLIVDDERYARDELKHLLTDFPSILIIGEAASGEEAIVKSLQLEPNVVFLDIEMPKLDGMKVAKSLLELKKVPQIILATAHPQFAAEAFRLNVLDYLLKPYDKEQLEQTINRIKKRLLPSPVSDNTKLGKLAIEAEGEIHYIFPKEILYIFREGHVSKVITKREVFQVKVSLKELENRLIPYSFFRIHKSYLVNLNDVTRLTPWFNGAFHLELEGREEHLPVSRNYVKELRKRMEL